MTLVEDPTTLVPDRIDRFNARDMTATEVVDTFVRPGAFDKILVPSNTLLMGPRGSGKTTLLKMLTPEAIERWSTRVTAASEPSFSGIYVPIDVQLSDHLESIASSKLPQELVEITVRSIYALHVFRCVVESFSWHCKSSNRHSLHTLLPSGVEADVVDELSALWGVGVSLPTVTNLQRALRIRQVRAIEAWSRQVLQYRSTQKVIPELVDVVELDAGLKGAVEILCEVADWKSGTRWAVLFDEVEVAPSYLQTILLSYLRFSDPRILFKVAIAPYMQSFRGLPDRSRGSALNDYGVIDLQSASETEIRDFSVAFFAQACAAHGTGDLDLYQSLGPSLLAGGTRKSGTGSYTPNSEQSRGIRQLAARDPSFAAYLSEKGLSPQDLIADQESDERAPFRKARQVALVRNAYLSNPKATGRRLKTRTSAHKLYVGAESIVRMCEGNPRRLAFIVPMLLDELRPTGRVPYGAQVLAIDRTEAVFRSFLRGLPIDEALGAVLSRGVLSFIDVLGHSFHDQLVKPDFTDDPISSFTVDSDAGLGIEELIARGVNSGALVQLSDSDYRGMVHSLAASDPISVSRGKRFRLSYLLAPGYGLMLRVGRSVSLTTMMRRVSEVSDGADKRIGQSLSSKQEGLW